MKIDITDKPPEDIFKDRGKYIRIAVALLSLVVCGILLAVYGIVADIPQSDTLETASLVLIVAPGLVFVYFGQKLQAYKRLNPEQKKKLADLGRQHPEIAAYCALVEKTGRQPIFAEYEACLDLVEDVRRNQN